mmetsp:Transcript_24034/g.63482  ORF Transcript_24034/g.63482 Transcript_24034/m.63482 type:complete len:326 (+) Transcript_24034:643-1620(+)
MRTAPTPAPRQSTVQAAPQVHSPSSDSGGCGTRASRSLQGSSTCCARTSFTRSSRKSRLQPRHSAATRSCRSWGRRSRHSLPATWQGPRRATRRRAVPRLATTRGTRRAPCGSHRAPYSCTAAPSTEPSYPVTARHPSASASGSRPRSCRSMGLRPRERGGGATAPKCTSAPRRDGRAWKQRAWPAPSSTRWRARTRRTSRHNRWQVPARALRPRSTRTRHHAPPPLPLTSATASVADGTTSTTGHSRIVRSAPPPCNARSASAKRRGSGAPGAAASHASASEQIPAPACGVTAYHWATCRVVPEQSRRQTPDVTRGVHATVPAQ